VVGSEFSFESKRACRLVENRPSKTDSRSSDAPPIGEVEGKGRAVEAMFDRIAPRYDLLNRLLSFGIDRWWRRRAVEALEEALGGHPPARLLDVATGTADLALRAAEAFDAAEVVGVDIAEEMLRLGRGKAQQRGLAGRVRLERGDATDLTFDDGAFDGALVAFGVRNFEDLGAGLAEMHRVLGPGGALVVLEFSHPRAPVFRQLFDLYSRHVLPRVGRLLSGDTGAYRYLPASVEAFPDGPTFLRRMRRAGFHDARWQPLFPIGIASLYVGTV
jgi:demethylmenaquinone methyltransferase/2-methoxy-6-polyprenyl-1,4-benzoquinol methylase